MFDVVIIGGGPAGYSAALTSVKRNMKTCMIYPKDNGSMLKKITWIDNYPGLIDASGEDMLKIFERQATDLGVTITNGVVKQVIPNGDTFFVSLGNEFIDTKKVILALGIKQGGTIKNEELYVGKGVSYCATCDGMLYKGKNIIVVDENNNEEEIVLLSELVSHIYLVSNSKYDNLPQNVEVVTGKPIEIYGNELVQGMVIDDSKYEVDGIFIFRNTMALNTLLPGLDMNGSFIKVDDRLETSLKGVFAAGDCIGQPFQVAVAVGRGNLAAISASTKQ